MKYLSVCLLAAGVASAAACGGDDKPPPLEPDEPTQGTAGNRGANGGSGGTDAGGGTGGGAMGMAGGATVPVDSDEGAPMVAIESPVAVEDPTGSTDVVSGTEVTVGCTVTASMEDDAEPVDPSTVKVGLLNAAAEVVVEAAASDTNMDGTYEGTVSLAEQESGPLRFFCSAADTAATPRVGRTTLETFHDQGPVITVVEPLGDSAYPSAQAVKFVFDVAPDLLAPGDGSADVGSVVLTVAGQTIEVTERADMAGRYEATVDFSDPTTFTSIPQGQVGVAIRATNGREVTARENYFIVVDDLGPTVSDIAPDPTTSVVVAGDVQLSFKVEDTLSGIDPRSVQLEFPGEDPLPYDPDDTDWGYNPDTGVFTYQFDTRETPNEWRILINVLASDLAGNRSEAGISMFLDYEPPSVDLDLPLLRQRNSANDECSAPFDPLGADASKDREIVSGSPRFRVWAWDETNEAGQSTRYYSTLDQSQTALFMTKGDTPLFVDNNGDGVCDDIDYDAATVQELAPLNPQRTAFYGTDAGPTDFSVEPNVESSSCVYASNEPTTPDPLCSGQSLTFVPSHSISGGRESVVYVVPPINNVDCTGGELEIRPLLESGYEGWACIAAKADDQVGNRGISPPHRVCITDGVLPDPPCATGAVGDISSDDPPSCTQPVPDVAPDGCTIPADWGWNNARRLITRP